MSANGQLSDVVADGRILRWQGRVVTADDLRRALNGHAELLITPQTVITPLAAEELWTRGVQVTREAPQARPAPTKLWGYAQDRPHLQVASAVQALRREGVELYELSADTAAEPCRWARGLAECVASGACTGGVLFCADPALVCCVANKRAGLRAVAVTTIAQASRALLTLAPNLFAVEMPGRTFFEVRQILRTLCLAGAAMCPPGVACTLQELDGHAHR
jgi:hypothetical protein